MPLASAYDLPHLRRCVELATEAVDAEDFPFGSVLVAADGRVLAELGVPASPVRALPVGEVAPGLLVQGPVPGPARAGSRVAPLVSSAAMR